MSKCRLRRATSAPGQNALTGNGAANVLNGAGGADVLKSLGGNDTFRYASAAECRGTAIDRILDFDSAHNCSGAKRCVPVH